MKSTIESVVSDTLDELYNDHGTTANERPDSIEGFCHENALALAENIHYHPRLPTPIIVWGTIASTSDTYSIPEAERSGGVHLWVEIPKTDLSQFDSERDISEQGDMFVADCYAFGENKGESYVSDQLPNQYIRLTGGYIEYNPDLRKEDLTGMNRYQDIPEDWFVFEKQEF